MRQAAILPMAPNPRHALMDLYAPDAGHRHTPGSSSSSLAAAGQMALQGQRSAFTRAWDLARTRRDLRDRRTTGCAPECRSSPLSWTTARQRHSPCRLGHRYAGPTARPRPLVARRAGLPGPITPASWRIRRALSRRTWPPDTAISGFIGLAGPYRGGLCAGRPARPRSRRQPRRPARRRLVDRADPPCCCPRRARQLCRRRPTHGLAEAGTAAGVDVTIVSMKTAATYVVAANGPRDQTYASGRRLRPGRPP